MQKLFGVFHVWKVQTFLEKSGINLGIANKLVQNQAYDVRKIAETLLYL
ncbi:MAG: hypothetical protein KME08_21780 [Aphanothece sp. CMT-3BRIN-NPC111]|jgi:hypothetical protein|nr:hypothetical protein [Aphanothece sp. CMT-3BRIN-NPC111]